LINRAKCKEVHKEAASKLTAIAKEEVRHTHIHIHTCTRIHSHFDLPTLFV
jgi:hypothetical protein